ncbi:MAG TPA: glycosyltransferase [Vicinamibacterales bacterium]|nr:glycosyltransferase [Vicinamibacterales bacterium]
MKRSAATDAGRAPLVSIVTPAYNAAPYLAETTGSVLGQTFSDFEHLIVDDGSTDETLTEAHRLAATDGRIHVVSTPNGGPATARNVALRAARGEFIALLDSDDLWRPHYLATQLDILASHPEVSIVTSNAMNLGGGANYDGKPFWPTVTGLERLTAFDLISREDSVCILSVMRRSVYDTIGGFNPEFSGNEDYEFWLRASLAGLRILRNHEPLAVYRRHSGSLSSDEPKMIRGAVKVLQHIDTLLDEMPQERAALYGQVRRFTRELPRADLRASLQRSDAASAARVLRALAAERGGWTLGAVARFMTCWPRPLLWAYKLRRSLNSA